MDDKFDKISSLGLIKPEGLDRMSIESLNIYLAELEEESFRVKNEITKKSQYLSKADAIFDK
tara:strand:+ start:108 stop:293 length:186 start_codon:yes stop_codon:yes gene_type:complete